MQFCVRRIRVCANSHRAYFVAGNLWLAAAQGPCPQDRGRSYRLRNLDHPLSMQRQ